MRLPTAQTPHTHPQIDIVQIGGRVVHWPDKITKLLPSKHSRSDIVIKIYSEWVWEWVSILYISIYI